MQAPHLYPLTHGPYASTKSTLLSGLVACWQFDVPGKPGRDSTGTYFASAVQVGPSGGVSTALPSGGGFHTSLSSNLLLTSGFIQATFSPGSGNFTVCAWVNPQSSGNYVLLSKGALGNSLAGSEWIFNFLNTSKHFQLAVTPEGTAAVQAFVQTPANAASGLHQWYFVAGWYDGAHLNIQLNNGAITQTAYTSGVYRGGLSLRIGRDTLGNATPDAVMTGLGYWSRVLSAGELTSLYAGGLGISYPFYGT